MGKRHLYLPDRRWGTEIDAQSQLQVSRFSSSVTQELRLGSFNDHSVNIKVRKIRQRGLFTSRGLSDKSKAENTETFGNLSVSQNARHMAQTPAANFRRLYKFERGS